MRCLPELLSYIETRPRPRHVEHSLPDWLSASCLMFLPSKTSQANMAGESSCVHTHPVSEDASNTVSQSADHHIHPLGISLAQGRQDRQATSADVVSGEASWQGAASVGLLACTKSDLATNEIQIGNWRNLNVNTIAHWKAN